MNYLFKHWDWTHNFFKKPILVIFRALGLKNLKVSKYFGILFWKMAGQSAFAYHLGNFCSYTAEKKYKSS